MSCIQTCYTKPTRNKINQQLPNELIKNNEQWNLSHDRHPFSPLLFLTQWNIMKEFLRHSSRSRHSLMPRDRLRPSIDNNPRPIPRWLPPGSDCWLGGRWVTGSQGHPPYDYRYRPPRRTVPLR